MVLSGKHLFSVDYTYDNMNSDKRKVVSIRMTARSSRKHIGWGTRFRYMKFSKAKEFTVTNGNFSRKWRSWAGYPQ
jgi:hypothetical protein